LEFQEISDLLNFINYKMQLIDYNILRLILLFFMENLLTQHLVEKEKIKMEITYNRI